MSESKQKIVSPKRSSLRNSTNNLNIKEYIIHKPQKRNSVSWNMGGKLNLDKMKPNFKENENSKNDEKETEERNKKFKEARRRSVINEFTLVKELLSKNQNAIEEFEDDDEIKKNTEKNLENGKKALNMKDSDSESES
jgi:hypothetical protein